MENKKILTLFNTKQFIFFLLGIAAAVIFFVMTPFEGLSAEGMKVLGLFLLAIFWWMGSVFPDYVTAFWMMALMIATKATALGTVFSAFSGSVIWIVIPVLAVGAALIKPFMPDTAAEALSEIGAEERGWDSLDKFGVQKTYRVSAQPKTLFARIKFADIAPEIEKIAKAQREAAAPSPENKAEEVPPITIDDFAKVRMQVGTVVACEPVKKSKLLHETVDIGGKTISVLSGIAKHYTAEEMVGKKVVVVTNLPPREMKGLKSEGMIVCAEAPDGTLSLVCPEKDVPSGSVLS